MASKLQTATDTSILHIKSIINDYYQFHQIIETAEGCHLWSQGPNSNGYVRLNFKLISSITKTEINPKIGLHEVQCFLKEDNVEKAKNDTGNVTIILKQPTQRDSGH